MKSKFLFSVILAAGLMLLSFPGSQVYGQPPQKKTAAVQTVKYTCPVHPQVIKEKPGKCPIDGIALVVEKERFNGTMQQMNDSMMMRHNQMRIMRDSTTMRTGAMMQDTNLMNKRGTMNNTKMHSMMPDTTMMNHGKLMRDTTSKNLNRMKRK